MKTASCLCGAVRLEIDGDLAPIQVCHCVQCRKAQGTAFATNIPVASSSVRVVAGADALREFESSPGKKRAFCGCCGSPVYSRRDAAPDVLRIRAGIIDGDLDARPASHAYVAEKANWWEIRDSLPQFSGGCVAVKKNGN